MLSALCAPGAAGVVTVYLVVLHAPESCCIWMQEWMQQHQAQSKHLAQFQMTYRSPTNGRLASEASNDHALDSMIPTSVCTVPLDLDAVLGKLACLCSMTHLLHDCLQVICHGMYLTVEHQL